MDLMSRFARESSKVIETRRSLDRALVMAQNGFRQSNQKINSDSCEHQPVDVLPNVCRESDDVIEYSPESSEQGWQVGAILGWHRGCGYKCRLQGKETNQAGTGNHYKAIEFHSRPSTVLPNLWVHHHRQPKRSIIPYALDGKPGGGSCEATGIVEAIGLSSSQPFDLAILDYLMPRNGKGRPFG